MPGNPADHAQLIEEIARRLTEADLRLVTAESCTGGLIAATLTDWPGSSRWFEAAFVTYRLSAKTRLLGVPIETLERFGAVSEPTARAMAEGALTASDATISVSVTGVAGPEGGDAIAPVGTVWLGWALRNPDPRCVQTERIEIDGDRAAVRSAAVQAALEGLRRLLEPANPGRPIRNRSRV
jgi:nicotinamide-nucleotide amidase